MLFSRRFWVVVLPGAALPLLFVLMFVRRAPRPDPPRVAAKQTTTVVARAHQSVIRTQASAAANLIALPANSVATNEPTVSDRDDIYSIMERTMEDRGADPRWSIERERQLREGFLQMEGTGIIDCDAKCADMLCRITVRYDNADSQANVVTHVNSSGVATDTNTLFKVDEERKETVIYMSRPGFILPDKHGRIRTQEEAIAAARAARELRSRSNAPP